MALPQAEHALPTVPASRRLIEILCVALRAAAGTRQVYGLLISQVHSIVRLDARDARLQPGGAGGLWELSYEGSRIPVWPLRQVLGLGGPTGAPAWEPAGTVCIVALLERSSRPDAPPASRGLVVDEVVEIVSYPLDRIQRFPPWVTTRLPRGAVWGAIPGEDGQILLLLDTFALPSGDGPGREAC